QTASSYCASSKLKVECDGRFQLLKSELVPTRTPSASSPLAAAVWCLAHHSSTFTVFYVVFRFTRAKHRLQREMKKPNAFWWPELGARHNPGATRAGCGGCIQAIARGRMAHANLRQCCKIVH